ncbi:hypothetical protein Tco_1462758 [Tanacetum coccineum]
MKIQAGVQVSIQGELRRHLQLWKCFGRLYFIVIVLNRNIVSFGTSDGNRIANHSFGLMTIAPNARMLGYEGADFEGIDAKLDPLSLSQFTNLENEQVMQDSQSDEARSIDLEEQGVEVGAQEGPCCGRRKGLLQEVLQLPRQCT